MYGGFLDGYATLKNSFLNKEIQNGTISQLMNKRIAAIFSNSTAKSALIANALRDVGSGDINRLTLLSKSIGAHFQNQPTLLQNLTELIALKKTYKQSPENKTTSMEESIKTLTKTIIIELNTINTTP